jgi:hypothetical protein
MIHCSTVEERIHMVSQILGTPSHGLVSQLSRRYHVSRQTLYRWKATGVQALEAALGGPLLPQKPNPLPSLILTLLVETHASYREIQACLKTMHGIDLSLGNIATIVKVAGQEAQKWLEHQQALTPRALALDEQYGSQRGRAYLNVIDVHSGQVWMTIAPVAVDGESWTLVLWSLQEQGITCSCTVSDGGLAIAEALSRTQNETQHQRDVWHLFQFASRVIGHLDRAIQAEQACLPAIKRMEERQALGTVARGRPAKASMVQQEAKLARLSYVADAVRYLCSQLHTLLEVVVVHSDQLLTTQQRQEEIEVVLALLDELVSLASPQTQGQIQKLAKHIRLALPQALLFARSLEQRQEQAKLALGRPAVALLGWAWLRRKVLGPTSNHLLQSIDPAWRTVAADLLTVWDHAVRASSVVENWHSILRPHLAVHRKLSAGMLALLAVWHNHRIAPRGVHEGLSPLQRTDSSAPDHHWLVALGYSPFAA